MSVKKKTKKKGIKFDHKKLHEKKNTKQRGKSKFCYDSLKDKKKDNSILHAQWNFHFVSTCGANINKW